ncbi:tetratricopeptide repeat protein [Anaerolineae bacterium CFX7]|nr:tetratricopeptide repeat protein [Anaerolineae bacterium CFX7]
MGDANNINLGANAQARQVAAGSDITQIIIENFVARAPARDARFSLPRAPENFTGRADEIETLVNALTRDAPGAARGAALTGVSGLGGIGKSALAAVAAQRVAENFPDAQLWLNLRGTDQEYAKPSDVMREIIFALDPETGAALKDASDAQIAQVYRSILSAQRALIVLDNARDNAQVRPLLQAHATFLVTSRANLTEGGLHALRLGVMRTDEAEAYMLRLCPRLQTADIKSPTTELCQVCGYLPLALKIAGSYLAARPNVRAENYVEQLKRARLALLREGAEAEANVEATFSQTYAQLTLTQQILFDALSVFPAPFTLQAAAYVWGLGEIQAEAALGELIRASFVEFETADKAAETRDRYFLHDLLREFGAARQTDANRRQATKRHAEFYEQVARAAKELYLQGNENIVAGLKLFDDELPHMRAGQAYAAANMDRDDDAARLCSAYPDAAVYVANLRLPVREWIRWLEQALNAARKLGNRSGEGVHLGNLGLAYADLGDARQAIAFYEQALAIDREIGDRRGEGADLGNLGLAYAALGDARQAIAFYEQHLVIAREIGDRRGEGNALGNLGNAYAALGDARQAIAFYEQHLVIAREIGDRRGEGADLGNLGNAYAALGDARQAIAFYKQYLVITREIGDRRGEGNALANMGLAYKELGDANKAKTLWRAALEIYEAIEDPNAKRVKKWLEE